MVCVGPYENQSPIYETFIEKNKCIHTNNILENGLMYLYCFSNLVLEMPPLHIHKINHELNRPLSHIKFTFSFQYQSIECFILFLFLFLPFRACNSTIVSN